MRRRATEARAKDAVEADWLKLLHEIPCVLCAYLGFSQGSPTEAHHVREGVGLSQRASHFRCAALCRDHHSGSLGVHGLGTRGLYRQYRLDELDLVDMTVRAMFVRLRDQKRSSRWPM